ncbi:unnamed protein product [Pleuronectes platessa]|uniref:Uncharacterized protein n=1 Tax=Pleuronectes platessa TaxID=8262 RepID=A0A9N7VQN4_PLEPL|nr:unnamed protein product [Pleuronectes platessa]
MANSHTPQRIRSDPPEFLWTVEPSPPTIKSAEIQENFDAETQQGSPCWIDRKRRLPRQGSSLKLIWEARGVLEDQSTTQWCGETAPLQKGEGDRGRGGEGARSDEEGEEVVEETHAQDRQKWCQAGKDRQDVCAFSTEGASEECVGVCTDVSAFVWMFAGVYELVQFNWYIPAVSSVP